MSDYLRGHFIVLIDDEWYYEDSGEPTVGNKRDCGHCGKPNTKEGYDGCIGELPDVMNACCGHGQDNEAYIQYWDGSIIDGKKAITIMNQIKGVEYK